MFYKTSHSPFNQLCIYIHMFHLSPPQMIGCMQSFHVMPSYQQTYQAHVSNLPSNQPHDPLGIFQMIVTILGLLGVLHPGRLTAGTYKSPMLIMIFQTSMILFHVNLQGFYWFGFFNVLLEGKNCHSLQQFSKNGQVIPKKLDSTLSTNSRTRCTHCETGKVDE